MPSVFILTPGARAHLEGERLVVEAPPDDDLKVDGTAYEIFLREIEQVVLTESVSLTMPALAELMRHDIPMFLTSHGERVIGICQPPSPNCVARLEQYRKSGDEAWALATATRWVEAKILNSRRVLQRLAVNRKDSAIQDVLAHLEELAGKCPKAESLDTLRGFEGTAAGRYFEAYATFFPDDCPFERRSRRPPHNAVNALLSYAYTLLGAEMECQLHTVGLDPCVGFLHEPADRRASLALDMIEPFRAPVADAMALDLVSHATVNPQDHFEARDGGVYMNTEGKKRFFVAYERRMGREFYCEQTGKRTTLRQEFHNQAQALKQAIVNGEKYEPFIMN
ncbi:MAG: CRISPR-associated endonuclease Cas1 [Lentisphaerota bacterium]